MSATLVEPAQASLLQFLSLAVTTGRESVKDVLIEKLLLIGASIEIVRRTIQAALSLELVRALEHEDARRWNALVCQALREGMCIQAIIEAICAGVTPLTPKRRPKKLPTSDFPILPADALARPAPLVSSVLDITTFRALARKHWWRPLTILPART